MELQTITEDPHVARRAFLDYRKLMRSPAKARLSELESELREIDREMLRAYRQLARGVALIRLSETIRAGGWSTVEARWGGACAVPNIAIARAASRTARTNAIRTAGDVGFSWALTDFAQELSWSRENSVQLEGVFSSDPDAEGRPTSSERFAAAVPTVPPRFRPQVGLGGYHVLFEAAWAAEPVPSDPALLKHLGGDLWAVVASWDLTPLEAAVLGQRS